MSCFYICSKNLFFREEVEEILLSIKIHKTYKVNCTKNTQAINEGTVSI